MRRLINTLLACLILACPLLCGAEEAGHGVQREHSGKGDSPAHCPENGDNCVCRGAVQTNNARTIAPNVEVPGRHYFLAPSLLHARPFCHLTWEGPPAGLASWGDSLTIRALLQNFRC